MDENLHGVRRGGLRVSAVGGGQCELNCTTKKDPSCVDSNDKAETRAEAFLAPGARAIKAAERGCQ